MCWNEKHLDNEQPKSLLDSLESSNTATAATATATLAVAATTRGTMTNDPDSDNAALFFWRGFIHRIQHLPYHYIDRTENKKDDDNDDDDDDDDNNNNRIDRDEQPVVNDGSSSLLSKTVIVSGGQDDDDVAAAGGRGSGDYCDCDNDCDGDRHDNHNKSGCCDNNKMHDEDDDDEDYSSSTTLSLPLPLPLFDPKELVMGDLVGKGSFCHVYELNDVNLFHTNTTTTTTTTTTSSGSGHSSSSSSNNNNNKQDGVIVDDCDDDDEMSRLANKSRLRFYNSLHTESSSSSKTSSSSFCKEKQQQQKGQPRHRRRYVVKRLRSNLGEERGRKIFYHAATDIREEFKLLSLIRHPNIVHMYGGYRAENSKSKNKNNKGGDDFISMLSSSAQNRSKTLPSSPAVPLEDTFFMILERLDKTLSQQIQEWKNMEKDGSSSSSIVTTTSITSRESRYCDDNARLMLYTTKLRYAYEIANALAWMHSHRLINRDVKCDNIGITPDGKIKIFDLGLARSLPTADKAVKSYHRNGRRELMFRMSGVGTRRYMSPECIVGHIYNQSADCYSWAMVFYEMLSLQKPFASYNREVHRIVVCEHHERPCVSSTEENIPPDARRLLQHAWAQDPVDRPSMQELCDDDLKPMIERAQRLLLTPTERSSAAIMEMSELFGGITDVPIETKSSSSTTKSSWFPLRSLLSSGLEHQKRDRNQKLSRRLSTADMTVSTALTSTSRSSTSSSTPITSAGGSCGGGSGINNDHDPHVQFLNVGAPTGMIAFPGISCWLDM